MDSELVQGGERQRRRRRSRSSKKHSAPKSPFAFLRGRAAAPAISSAMVALGVIYIAFVAYQTRVATYMYGPAMIGMSPAEAS